MCWDSSRVIRRTVGSALVLALAAGVTFPAMAGAATRADSARSVRRIVVSDDGVRMQGAGGDSLSEPADRFNFNVGNKRHRVRVGDVELGETHGRSNVRVVGPMVMVDGTDAGLVRVFADADVPKGERIEGDVVAVCGSVTVEGQVSGNVVAVLGNVHLAPGAVVDGDAVAIGGTLDQPTDATVSGQSVSLGFLPITWGLPALPILLFAVLLGWLSTLFLGWILNLLFRRRMLRVAVTASRRTGLSLFLGLVSAPLMIVAMALLVITVLGIPIAALLPIFYGLMVWAGQIAASYVIGCKLLRRPVGSGGPMVPLIAGTLFVATFFLVGAGFAAGFGFGRPLALFFQLLGLLLLIGLTTIGTGAFILSGLGSRPADVDVPSPAGSGSMLNAPGAPAIGL